VSSHSEEALAALTPLLSALFLVILQALDSLSRQTHSCHPDATPCFVI
jgi:hypothetical protein